MRKTGHLSRLGCCGFLLVLCMPSLAITQQTAPEQTPSDLAQRNSPTQSKSNPPKPAASQAGKRTRPDYVRKAPTPAYNAAPVTVAQLEEVLRQAHGKHDKDVARELSLLALTERMNSARLASWQAALHGKRSREALTALADASVFLDLPATEIPVREKPDIAEQQRILDLAIAYLNKTLPRLRNFSVMRTATRYLDTLKDTDEEDEANFWGQPWRMADRSSETVLYRDGKEVVDSEKEKHRKRKEGDLGLVLSGIFGRIQAVVIVDAAHGKLVWGHWEQGAAGPEAVFRYTVPEDASHYGITYASVSGESEATAPQQRVGYHGEVVVDPTSGAILRLTLQTDLKRDAPVVRSDIMVEFGPEQMGTETFVCPVRSVAISSGRAILENQEDGQRAFGPEVTILSDVVFGPYKLLPAAMKN